MVVARERSFAARRPSLCGRGRRSAMPCAISNAARCPVVDPHHPQRGAFDRRGRATDSAPRSASGRDRAGPAALRDISENAWRATCATMPGSMPPAAVLWPAPASFMLQYPDTTSKSPLIMGSRISRVTALTPGASRRTGGKDMIAVRIAPDMRMAVGFSPWPICAGRYAANA